MLEPLPRLVVFNASFLISRVVHNNWLYLNRVNIFYSIFILMRFKSLFKNFPNCGWFWIKTDLHFWAKKTCIFVSRSVGVYIYKSFSIYLQGLIFYLQNHNIYTHNTLYYLCPVVNGILNVGLRAKAIQVKSIIDIKN